MDQLTERNLHVTGDCIHFFCTLCSDLIKEGFQCIFDKCTLNLGTIREITVVGNGRSLRSRGYVQHNRWLFYRQASVRLSIDNKQTTVETIGPAIFYRCSEHIQSVWQRRVHVVKNRSPAKVIRHSLGNVLPDRLE